MSKSINVTLEQYIWIALCSCWSSELEKMKKKKSCGMTSWQESRFSSLYQSEFGQIWEEYLEKSSEPNIADMILTYERRCCSHCQSNPDPCVNLTISPGRSGVWSKFRKPANGGHQPGSRRLHVSTGRYVLHTHGHVRTHRSHTHSSLFCLLKTNWCHATN